LTEIEEIKRTILELNLAVSPEKLESLFDKTETQFIDLKDFQIENMDYLKESESPIDRLKVYDPERRHQLKRYKKTLNKVKNGNYSPVLILNANDSFYLIAGNTRCMICQLLNKLVKAKILTFLSF
jgi:hypothetical protein